MAYQHAEDDVRASLRHCLVVVPTYNEALNIERLLEQILHQGPQFDVLVVDDGSPHGTGDLVAAFAERTPRVQLLRRPVKLGLGSVYLAGFDYGLRHGYRYLCEMDADFSHRTRILLLVQEPECTTTPRLAWCRSVVILSLSSATCWSNSAAGMNAV